MMVEKRERTGDPNHPRPQLQRAAWESLNGSWDFAIDAKGEIGDPTQVTWGPSDHGAICSGDDGERCGNDGIFYGRVVPTGVSPGRI